GNDALNAIGPQTSDFWQPNSLPAFIGAALPSAEFCDSFAIFGHTLGSSGATATLQRREAAAGPWLDVASISPEDNRDIFMIFGEEPGIEWRIRITGSSLPFVSIAWIGPRLLIPGGVLE